MKKIALLVCLVFSLGLNANVVDQNTAKTTIGTVDISDDGKYKMKRQIYSEDGSLKSYVIARTNLAKGTYTEYYENGNLKLFRIVH